MAPASSYPPRPAPPARPQRVRRTGLAQAKQEFARAVDLYFARRYAQALAVFLSLNQTLPNDPDIQKGRMLCVRALQAAPALAIEHKKRTPPALTHNPSAELDAGTVKKFILEKMLHGETEAVQLRAAELASRIVGLAGPEEGEAAGLGEALASLAAQRSSTRPERDAPAPGAACPAAGPSRETPAP